MTDAEISRWNQSSSFFAIRLLKKLRGTKAPNNGDLAKNIDEYNKRNSKNK